MMRADICTLLSVSMKTDLVKDAFQGESLEKGLHTMLELEFHDDRYNDLVKDQVEEIDRKLFGW